MSTKELTPLDGTPDIEKIREKAIAFYDEEHTLKPDERRQLYVFYEQQCRRMLLGFSVGVALGTACPFIVKKKGTLVHPALPIIGAVVGGTVVPGLVNHSIYTLQVDQFRRKYGDMSPICRTIEKTPDPISKAVYWSNYFKKSSENPNFRMKDPRTVVDSTKFFSIEDNPKIPPYGKPGYYKSDQSASPPTLNEQYLSEWDKVRMQNAASASGTGQAAQTAPLASDPYMTTPHDADPQDPFAVSDPPRTIGDSYASGDRSSSSSSAAAAGQHRGSSNTSGDHLIEEIGASGNAWERVRHQQGRPPRSD